MRDLDQKFVYFGDWAKKFYDVRKNKDLVWDMKAISYDEYAHFWGNTILSWVDECIIVSLGVWNAEFQSYILKPFAWKKKITLTAVDACEDMIIMAKKNLRPLAWLFTIILIHWDFSSRDFHQRLKLSIFFVHLCVHEDLVWLDIVMREGTKNSELAKDFQRYESLIISPESTAFAMSFLETLDINRSDWRQWLFTHRLDVLKCIMFEKFFSVEQKNTLTMTSHTHFCALR